jgi:hypothetical protein
MSRAPAPIIKMLNPEKVAYWYFRLNGFFQIENFIVHPELRGSQRTDADLLAVRFPFRAERLFDNPGDIMADDEHGLAFSRDLIDIVIAEVKTNQPCNLNGPWTQQDRQNIHRVLAAIGCLPHDRIEAAASDIYRVGFHYSDTIRIRLVAIGRNQDAELATKFPEVSQLLWSDMLSFIWQRFDRYRQQKTQVDQWDGEGRKLKRLTDEHHRSCEEFIRRALDLMGVNHG